MTVSYLTFRKGVRQVTYSGLPQKAHDTVPELFQYPGGEWSLRHIPEFDEPATWAALVRGGSAEDILKAALLADVAHRRGDRFVLLMPYAPAARADKGEQEASVYAKLINSMISLRWRDKIVVLDPHSDFVMACLNRPTELELPPLVERAIAGFIEYDAVIAPDAGAKARANLVADHLGLDVYTAHKKRDFETGKILSIGMDKPLPKGRYLVVDDICDGGGTFMGLADAIRDGHLMTHLDLWVTHGIFSGRAEKLRDHYQHIYTTDSHPGHSRVGCATTIVPLLPALMRECE